MNARRVVRACIQAMALGWGLPVLAAAAGEPPVPLSDGPAGMTCDYYVASTLVRWQRPGGDWLDAAGTPHGERPVGAVELQRSAVRTRVTLDATGLVSLWARGGAVPGGALLKPSAGQGPVEMGSREHPEEAVHPLLRLAWDDGRREELAPVADTFTACPTQRSLGADRLLQAGSGRMSLLVFPVRSRAGHKIVKAQLELSTLKVYGPMSLGLYALRTPAGVVAAVPAGVSAQYPGDAGLEKSSDVLFVERFERTGWSSAWQLGEGGMRASTLAVDVPNRFDALEGRALKISVEAGQNVGLDLQLPFRQLPGGEREEAFLRYYLRLGDDWDPTVDGGKLPGLAGTYKRGGWGGRKSDGYNGWSARGAFMRQPTDSPVQTNVRGIGTYLYHADGGTYGDILGWNLGPTGMLQKNRWYCIEQQVRMNRPGERDGVLRAWVDGQLAFERTDLRFRHVPDLRIETVWVNVYHGGMATAPKRMSLYIDNLVVAKQYVGPRLQP